MELAKEAARLIFAEWPKEVAGPIAEVSNVLTAGFNLGVVLSSYFASSAIETAFESISIAPIGWWRRPLVAVAGSSLSTVLVGSLALLALAFLVVLGPLILDALREYLPWVAARRPPPDVPPARRRSLHARDDAAAAHLILRPTGRGSSISCPGSP